MSSFLIVLLFISLNLQSLTLYTFGEQGIKLFHLISLLLSPVFFYKLRTRLREPPREIIVFGGVILCASLLAAPSFGLNGLFINYVYAFFIFLMAMTLFTSATRLKLSLAFAVWGIIISVYIKLGYYWDSIRDYLANPYAHPELVWFYGGGSNLEATWVVINGALLRSNRSFWPYWLLSFSLATLYASRVAMLLAAVLALIQIWSYGKRQMIWLLLLIPFGIVGVGGLVYSVNPYALQRFFQIGEDVGSATRLEMWRSSGQAILYWPLGYGAGNGIEAAERISNTHFLEDNVHNYLLQVTLDFGILGLIAWLFVIVYILRHFLGLRFADPLGTYVVLYLVGSLVQFRGAEPLFWFVMGLFVASRVDLMKRTKSEADRVTYTSL